MRKIKRLKRPVSLLTIIFMLFSIIMTPQKQVYALEFDSDYIEAIRTLGGFLITPRLVIQKF